ncbi:nucleoside-diphosphate kinase [Acrasis kona]|uniref:nucleoside-diphosphate kinase n=1 Tax=Acrasis kona TaxID=1008807 RepID=A0AAW2ZFH3_9EUKA
MNQFFWKAAGTLVASGIFAVAVSKLYNSRGKNKQEATEVNTEDTTKNKERILLIIQPEAIYRRKIGDIIHRFEGKGYKLCALKMVRAPIPESLPDSTPSGTNNRRSMRTSSSSTLSSTSSQHTTTTISSNQLFESMYIQYHPQQIKLQQKRQSHRHQFHTFFQDTAPPIPHIIVMVWQGPDVIRFVNHMVKSKTPGTFYSYFMQENSDSHDSENKFLYCSQDEERAREDIEYWFDKREIIERGMF